MATATAATVTHDLVPVTPSRDAVYDRSSLTGDYMVTVLGQTSEDFEKYAPESRYCDYINGVIYLPSPVTDRHQELVGFLFHLLHGLRCERGGGAVLMGPAVLRLSDEWKPEPDIFVRPDPAAPGPQPFALLVVEILSPSTRAHDLGLKSSVYRDAGVPEVWFLDERNHTLIVERKEGDDYRQLRLTEGHLLSTSIPNFWIDVAWLWEEPLPNTRRCLELILAGKPGNAAESFRSGMS